MGKFVLLLSNIFNTFLEPEESDNDDEPVGRTVLGRLQTTMEPRQHFAQANSPSRIFGV